MYLQKKSGFVLLACLLLITYANGYSQFVSYVYPVEPGQAVLSDKYKVYVSIGDEPEEELQVLMSHAIWEGDYRAEYLKGRTFSFVHISFNVTGQNLRFRVEKLFGAGASEAVVSPKNFEISPEMMNEGRELSFQTNRTSQYLSVDFLTSDNSRYVSGVRWITHMLCIFIDPLETDVPSKTGTGVVVYADDLPSAELGNASIIYFPAGYHNLKNYLNGGIIASDGTLTLKNGQSIYMEGGAFIEGIIERQDYSNANQKIYGRGILTGRQYLWRNHPDHTGKEYGQIVQIGQKAEISGVMIMDSPHHGIVGRDVKITNIKFLGWHCNNDGIRTGSGSVIRNSFIRAVDDHFYNFNISVSNVVLWAGHNGAIITYGWGGTEGSNTYNSGASTLLNLDIINPEWTHLGNNNGLIAAQVGLDYKPYGYGGSTKTTLRNIRIDGPIPGLVNLKPRTGANAVIIAVQVDDSKVGYIGDLLIENITVESQFSRGLIKGKADASYNGDKTFYIDNVEFKEIIISGTRLTEDNKGQYFDIEESTTKNLSFDEAIANSRKLTSGGGLQIFPNPVTTHFQINAPDSEEDVVVWIYDLPGKLVYKRTFTRGKAMIINRESLPGRGIYIVRLLSGNTSVTNKLSIL